MARKSGSPRKAAETSSSESWSDRGLRMFVALPFRMARQKIGFLRRNGLGAEIVLYDSNWICNYPADKVAELAALLKQAGVELSVHGPFYDLNPGSLDIVVRDYTRHCFLRTLAVCRALGAKALVLHPGLNPLLPESAIDGWLDVSVRTWAPIVEMSEQLGMTIRLENMWIPSPRFLIALKRSLKSDAVKICFDIGHFNVYSEAPLTQWLDELGGEVDEVHLNDNDGVEDVHLELGKGKIDFKGFFDELSARGIRPQFTIEMKSEKFGSSLAYLARNALLEPFAEA